jgi:8-oxo-dGTP pyrophosphatase MutT (NUDIX family)
VKVTWDGKPISPEPPFGCTVIVYRWQGTTLEVLMLHRASLGPAYEGEWAWTPPAGARLPGESVEACARRELAEEAGLVLPIIATDHGTTDWVVFVAEAFDQQVVLHDREHDRFVWLRPEDALARCLPSIARGPLEKALTQLIKQR